jgi:hypothetical protein
VKTISNKLRKLFVYEGEDSEPNLMVKSLSKMCPPHSGPVAKNSHLQQLEFLVGEPFFQLLPFPNKVAHTPPT